MPPISFLPGESMLNFYVEEVAEALHQAADLGTYMTSSHLRELANKLTGGLPRPGPSDLDWAYRHPRLECVVGVGGIYWLKAKTIDYLTWDEVYRRGWRPARFPLPSLSQQFRKANDD
jgi:hypothetical protein